jgi:hypothetical protein
MLRTGRKSAALKNLATGHIAHQMTLCGGSMGDMEGGRWPFTAAKPNGGFGTRTSSTGCLPALELDMF